MSTIGNHFTLQVGERQFLIDVEDVDKVSAHKWSVFDNGRGQVYAQANVKVPGKTGPRALRLHRLIVGLEFGDRRIVDHKNGNTLDNRKANLRIVDTTVNNINRKRRHGGPMKTKDGWVVRIWKGDVREYHGFYKDHAEALRVFNSVIGEAYGR